MKYKSFAEKFNKRVLSERPFFFMIDFEREKPVIFSPEKAYRQQIFFDFKGHKNFVYPKHKKTLPPLRFETLSKSDFTRAFEKVQAHIQNGDTYLLNLTFKTPVDIQASLKEVFYEAKAPYKIYYRNEFVCFSPETFVKIQGNQIATYPMKGTIDAAIPNAQKILLNNRKEYFEHNTIVDLLRNDLAIVATDIQVEKFRYVDKIKTTAHDLLQVSSKITGKLFSDWQLDAAEIFNKILPAGSVSGAPKQKTLEIIRKVETEKRGYYTGIAGYFDGQNFDTAVLIRFLEKNENGLFYRSGGGITALSKPGDEYNELKQKIYVPTD